VPLPAPDEDSVPVEAEAPGESRVLEADDEIVLEEDTDEGELPDLVERTDQRES
jgi:hypothetical protein